jgi:dTDP-4-dehydrorhamnose 3,5-epimerase
MLFSPLEVAGAYLTELDRKIDDRGFFSRTFCEEEFERHGLTTRFPQANLSHNSARGTLRGMHYAVSPSRESKLVRCMTGAIYDVLLDVRPDSPTFRKWTALELSRENGRAVFIPAGVAHGFLTLLTDTDVLYQMGDLYQPDTARGLRWNDEAFGVVWPFEPSVISERDASYPSFDEAAV